MKAFLAVLLLCLAGIAGAATNAPPPSGNVVKGVVLETKDAAGYTYLRLKTADGEIWAAVNKAAVAKGAEVTIVDAALMTNFNSPTLGRTFDKIVFGTLGGSGGAATGAAAGPAAGANPHAGAGAPMAAAPSAGGAASMHGSAPPAAAVADVKVAKATGPDARTVAEIAGTPALKNKTVVVRGKVVKYTPDVMGKNWIHLRDGSGSATSGTNDILVASKDAAKVGDVVLAKGVVRTDVDLGSGYSYKVLLDEATLAK
jgi:hypothetical protein